MAAARTRRAPMSARPYQSGVSLLLGCRSACAPTAAARRRHALWRPPAPSRLSLLLGCLPAFAPAARCGGERPHWTAELLPPLDERSGRLGPPTLEPRPLRVHVGDGPAKALRHCVHP